MDDTEEKRREWRAIRRREDARQRKLEELKNVIEDVEGGRKTAKSLLKIVIHGDGVKASDAADMLGVKKKTVDGWINALKSRKLVEVDGETHPNPTIKPSAEVLERLKRVRSSRSDAGPTQTELRRVEEELEKERRLREKLEDQLAEKDSMIKGVEEELLTEKKLRASLEERLKEAREERGEKTEETVEEFEKQLRRERAERKKLEDALRKKQEELESYERELERQRILEEDKDIELILDETPDERPGDSGRLIADIRDRIKDVKGKLASLKGGVGEEIGEIVDEEEEVSRILADEAKAFSEESGKPPAPEEEVLEGIPPEPAVEVKEEKVEASAEAAPEEKDEVNVKTPAQAEPMTEMEEAKPEEQTPAEQPAPEPVEENAEAPVERPAPAPEKPGVNVKTLVDLLSKKRKLKESEVKALAGGKASEWIRILADKGVVEVKSPMLGGKEVAVKEGADLEAVKAELEADEIREELRRMRGK